MATKKPHVLIVGAGLSGLTLAQCLRAKDHPFTIFERDESPEARAQGWGISIHTMLADLVAAVPADMPSIDSTNSLLPFRDLSHQICFYDTRIPDREHRAFIVESQPADRVGYGEGRVIRANRDRLRDWLLTNVDVQWSKQLVGFEQTDEDVTVTFADGTVARGDILVGADGSRSVVRGILMPDAVPLKVAECFVTGQVTISKEDLADQMRLSHSSYVVVWEGFTLFVSAHRVAPDASSADYYWNLIWHDDARAADRPHWIDSASSRELLDFAVEKTSGLEPKFSRIVRLSRPEGIVTPPIVLRDLVVEDMPVSRVTILGDAAHVMVPFKGDGGCHAMDDAIKLSRTLIGGGDLREFQREMLVRGAGAVQSSRTTGDNKAGVKTNVRMAWGQRCKPMERELGPDDPVEGLF